jgi:hypothetical protein
MGTEGHRSSNSHHHSAHQDTTQEWVATKTDKLNKATRLKGVSNACLNEGRLPAVRLQDN